jgi:hypothetical protein
VPFVYSTNGYQFVEFDRFTGKTSGPWKLTDFPTPSQLRARYEKAMGFSLESPSPGRCWSATWAERLPAATTRMPPSERCWRPSRRGGSGPCFGLDYTPGPPGDVLLICCEDDLADTVVPRLRAAGADLGRCHSDAWSYFITPLKAGLVYEHLRWLNPKRQREHLRDHLLLFPGMNRPDDFVILRLVQIRQDDGSWWSYVTNLIDEGLTPQDIAEIYSLRWRIEIFFRHLKHTLNREH